MKALSIRQPWARLILSGKKTIETRTWATKYRGDFIVASSAKPEGLDSGKALCIARLTDCRPMIESDEPAACCPLYPGAWAWILEDIRPIVPFPVKGRLSFYDVTMPQLSAPLPLDPERGQCIEILP